MSIPFFLFAACRAWEKCVRFQIQRLFSMTPEPLCFPLLQSLPRLLRPLRDRFVFPKRRRNRLRLFRLHWVGHNHRPIPEHRKNRNRRKRRERANQCSRRWDRENQPSFPFPKALRFVPEKQRPLLLDRLQQTCHYCRFYHCLRFRQPKPSRRYRKVHLFHRTYPKPESFRGKPRALLQK